VAYLGFWSKKARKSKKVQEEIEIGSYIGFFLQVPSCMYVFLTCFGMPGICVWFIAHDISFAWRISWIDNKFS